MGARHTTARLLLLGLDAAGKTTILYILSASPVTNTGLIYPTVETLEMPSGVTIVSWDLCYPRRLKPLLDPYKEAVDGLVFVVDSTDRERTEEAHDELNLLLDDGKLAGVPVLILANKQDLQGAMSVEELGKTLEVSAIRGRNWRICGTSAIHRQGVQEGLAWLILASTQIVLLVTSLIHPLFPRKEARVLLLGPPSSGKSTILYRLSLSKVVSSGGPLALTVETVKYGHVTFTAVSLPQVRWRPLLQHYFTDTVGVVYVVDVSDRAGVEQAKEGLDWVLGQEGLGEVAVLVLGNKTDVDGGMGTEELGERLGVRGVRGRNWRVQGCSGVTGDGVEEGLGWMGRVLRRKGVV